MIAKETLLPLVEQGKSQSTIAKDLKTTRKTIRKWLGRYGLKTNPTYEERYKNRSHHKPSEELKKRLSEKRKEWLKNNPDKHPWRRKNKHLSEPCEKLKEFLKNKNIVYVEEYQPLLNDDKFYSIDVAFPDKKLGLEVNGNQHYNRDGTLKDYYRERKELIEKSGWKLIDIHYSLVFNELFLKTLLEQIINQNIIDLFDYEKYVREKLLKSYEKEELKSKRKKKREEKLRFHNDILSLLPEHSMWEISKKLNTPYHRVRAFIIKNGIQIQKIDNKNEVFIPEKSERIYIKRNRKNKNEERKLLIEPLLKDHTIKEISIILNLCESVIYRVMKKTGLRAINENWRHEPKPNTRKVERPSKEQLEKLVWEIPLVQLSKKFGVSDVAIRKWCESYNISNPPRGYWAKKQAEQKLITNNQSSNIVTS